MTEAEQAAIAEDEAAAAAIARGAWAFQQLADDLCYDALDPAWHVRHGAALALREILRSQAAAASVEAPVASEPSGEAKILRMSSQACFLQPCSSSLQLSQVLAPMIPATSAPSCLR